MNTKENISNSGLPRLTTLRWKGKIPNGYGYLKSRSNHPASIDLAGMISDTPKKSCIVGECRVCSSPIRLPGNHDVGRGYGEGLLWRLQAIRYQKPEYGSSFPVSIPEWQTCLPARTADTTRNIGQITLYADNHPSTR